MGNSAYIRDLESLENLRIAIARFCEDSENQLNAIDSKLQSRLGNLKALESQFLRIVELARDNYQTARNARITCENNYEVDDEGNEIPPNCDYEKEEERDCRERLDFAENNYSSFKREIGNLERNITEYQNPKIKYKTLIQFEKEAATSSLKQLINGAEDYLSVSAPSENGLGLTEAIAKCDPTMVIAAAVGVAEILIMSVFAFLGASGNSYSISNKNSNGLITSTLLTEGKEYICSELKIDKKESVNSGKIVSVNIPQNLQNEKIGKHLIINMESTCRANDCKEISGWATSNNIKFYQGLGYQTRNEIKESGAEIFKPLESDFSDTQQKAHNAFENISDATFINSKNFGKLHVNPLHVISPAEINEEKFWKQHDRDGMERYIDQIEKYEKCKELISKGGTLDEIRKSDFKLVIAYENFVSKGDTIRLQKNGDYYKIDGGGRHRVAAAQIYFLRTGKIVPIEAEVKEIV